MADPELGHVSLEGLGVRKFTCFPPPIVLYSDLPI